MALRKKVFRRILLFLRKGISPHKLALSLALGITLGLIPLYGLTTILITLVAFGFRLNITATHFAHYIVHPIQIILFLPFLKIGDWLFNNSNLPGSFSQFLTMIKTDLWGTLHHFWLAFLTGTVVWLVISIPLALILYRFLFVSFRKMIPIRVK